MLTRRIIPCLDIKEGRTVKGVNFVGLRDAGDPVELARKYADQGADELVFLDIAATAENRSTLYELVEKVAEAIDIPFTVGGGISQVEQVARILNSGADKISLNSAAVKRPELISEIAERYGKQCVVVAIDAKFVDGDWFVHLVGGRQKTEIRLFDWAKEAVKRGAGELLFTSMDHDGTKNGFANKTLRELGELVHVPIIASGGAGSMQDFKDCFEQSNADAALAASVFHYEDIKIPELKSYLKDFNIPIRL